MTLKSISHATLLLLCLVAPGALRAQEPAATRLRVYLDCRARCDFDYIRTEMDFVDYVRDQADANVHILVTQQGTGTGSDEYTINFIGLETFVGINDTLRYVSPRDATDDEQRQGLTNVLRVGMMQFVGATPLAARVRIELMDEAPGGGGAAAAGPIQDPWNFWVFRIGLNGSLDGESQRSSDELELDLSATRITENWKVELGLEGGYEEERFEIEEDDGSIRNVFSLRKNYELDVLIVKSLNGHMSFGFEGGVESSTFGNEQFSWRLAPAFEYNVFPYTESTRRAFTIRYGMGVVFFDWRDTTIFRQVEETRPAHQLSAGYATSQPWGETSLSVDLSQYLHDSTKYRFEVGGDVEVRLLRGLSLEFGGSYARVRDQLSIPARGATLDEILLRQRELRTAFEYNTRIGISYRFGSIFNNVVNPRFRRNFSDFN